MTTKEIRIIMDLLMLEPDRTKKVDKADALYLLNKLLLKMDIEDDNCLQLLGQFLLVINSNFGDAECLEFCEIIDYEDPQYKKRLVKALCDL